MDYIGSEIKGFKNRTKLDEIYGFASNIFSPKLFGKNKCFCFDRKGVFKSTRGGKHYLMQ